MRKKICFACLLGMVAFAFAENIRLTELHIVDLKRCESIVCRYGAGIAVAVDTSTPFLQGIEIEIKQPQATIAFQNSLEYQIFSCKQSLSENKVNYKAAPIEKKILPTRVSTILHIPTTEQHNLENTAYARLVPHVLTAAEGAVLVRIQPILKGLSTEFEQSQFTITIRPIYTNYGGLSLDLNFPKGKTETRTTLNGEQISIPAPPNFLTVPFGEYELVLEAQEYRSEVRKIQIAKGQILPIEITLRSVIPLLCIYAPKEVEVYVDRNKVETINKPVEIPVGTHTVKLKLGSYEVVRQLDAEQGKTYTITMNIGVDVNIAE